MADPSNNTQISSKEASDSIKSIIIYGAIILDFVCFVVILYLNYRAAVWKESKFVSTLDQALWKLRTDPSALLYYDTISWWKLVFAGIILAATCILMLIRKLSISVSLSAALTLLAGWAAFISWFWRKEVEFKYSSNSAVVGRAPTKKPEDLANNASAKVSWDNKLRDIKSADDTRLPVTILTGFLGSGKTTLLKALLENTIGLKILVIENEIGAEGIDHELLLNQTGKENIILMNNGCICCTVRKDLIDTFHALFTEDRLASIDYVVIETTGLADPAPMIQSLYMDEQCKKRMRLDSVVALVDSVHFKSQSSTSSSAHNTSVPEAVQQVIFADRIVVSKLDLLTDKQTERAKEISELHSTIRSFNDHADIIHADRGAVHPSLLLNIQAYETNNKIHETLLKKAPAPFFIPLDSNGNIAKRKVVFDALNPVNVNRKASTGGGTIVTSITLRADKTIALDKFNPWITKLLQSNGQNIYRLKGFLYMEGFPGKVFVAHGVHMIFDGEVSDDWLSNQTSSDRESVSNSSTKGPLVKRTNKDSGSSNGEGSMQASRLVLIGVKLNEEEIKKGFQSCIHN